MTNDELRQLITQSEIRLGEKLDDIRTDVHGLRSLITGNGKPETGLLYRFQKVEDWVSILKKSALAFLLAGCTALGSLAVTRYVSTGEPPHDRDKVPSSRPSR